MSERRSLRVGVTAPRLLLAVGAAGTLLLGPALEVAAAGLLPVYGLRTVAVSEPGGVVIRSATVMGIPPGARLRVSCDAVCSLRTRSVTARGLRASLAAPGLEGRNLAVGSRFTVEIAVPDFYGAGTWSYATGRMRRIHYGVVAERGGGALQRLGVECLLARRTTTCPPTPEIAVPAASQLARGGRYLWVAGLGWSQFDLRTGRLTRRVAVNGDIVQADPKRVVGITFRRSTTSGEPARLVSVDAGTGRLRVLRTAIDPGPEWTAGITRGVSAGSVDARHVYVSNELSLEVVDVLTGSTVETHTSACPEESSGGAAVENYVLWDCFFGGTRVVERVTKRDLGVVAPAGAITPSVSSSALAYGVQTAGRRNNGEIRVVDLRTGLAQELRLKRSDGVPVWITRLALTPRYILVVDGKGLTLVFTRSGEHVVTKVGGDGGTFLDGDRLWLSNSAWRTVSRIDLRRTGPAELAQRLYAQNGASKTARSLGTVP